MEVSPDFILQNAKKSFGSATLEGGIVNAEFPCLKSIKAWMENGKLSVETVADKCADPMESIRRFNQFIEDVTGYTTKERKKLMSKV